MRKSSVWRCLLGVEKAAIEGAPKEAAGLVVEGRLHRRQRNRCGRCHRLCPGYDGGEGRRRWRALDSVTTVAFIHADAPRVNCPEHGVVLGPITTPDLMAIT